MQDVPQRIYIPMATGYDLGTDERVQEASKLLRLENCEVVERGAVRQRRGFRALGLNASDSTDMGTARAIASTGDELIVVRDIDVAAYDYASAQWLPRPGAISPFACDRRTVLRDEQSFPVCDAMRWTATGGSLGYIVHVAQSTRRAVAGSETIGVAGWVENDFEQQVVDKAAFDTLSGGDIGHAPRAAFSGHQLLMVYLLKTVNPVRIHLRYVDLDAIATGWVDGGDLVGATAANDADHGVRTFDAVGFSDRTGWALAYIDNASSNCVVQRRTTAHAVDASFTIVETVNRVSLFYLSEKVYVFVQVKQGAEAPWYELWAYRLDKATWAADWGPITVRVFPGLGAGQTGETLGITAGTIDVMVAGILLPFECAVCTWTLLDLSVSPPLTHTESRTLLQSTGALLDSTYQIWNCATQSMPWVRGGRAYVTVGTNPLITSAGAADGAAALGSTCAIVELRAKETTRTPRIVGYHNIGDAPLFRSSDNQNGVFGRGNGNRVYQDIDDQDCYDVTVRAETAVGIPSAATRDRFGIDSITLEYCPPVGVVSVYRSSALIGGAMVAWYDGARAFEVSEPIGYFITALSAVVEAGGSLNGTYAYQLSTESRDANGVLHRGPPGPVSPNQAVAPANNATHVTYRYFGVTNHEDNNSVGERLSVVLYRSDGAGGFVQARPKVEEYANSISAAASVTNTITDDGNASGAQIYTAGGVLESVSPEGGQFPTIIAQRCWLAPCSRKSDARYSKVFYASSSGQRIAPEFNDVMSVVLPNDDTAVVAAALDDRTVLFSSTKTYILTGTGPNDAGAGSDYGTPQLVSADVGCLSARSVVATPVGVFFQANAGIYLLTRNLELQSIGESVRDLLATYPVVTSAVVLPDRYQVRFTIAGRSFGDGGTVLVFDYRVGVWSRWILLDANGLDTRWIGACVHRPNTSDTYFGLHYLLSEDGVVATEDLINYKDSFASPPGGPTAYTWIPQGIETAWLQPDGQSGWSRGRGWIPLLKSLGSFALRARLYTDFNTSADRDITIPAATIAAWLEDPRKQPYIEVQRQEGQGFKLRLDTVDPTGVAEAAAKGFSCAGISLEYIQTKSPVKVANEQRI